MIRWDSLAIHLGFKRFGNTTSEDTKLEGLLDHYKDSFDRLQAREKKRERVSLFLLLALTVLVLQAQYPQDVVQAAQAILAEKFSLGDFKIKSAILTNLLWLLLAALVHMQYQIDILIQRQYPYIHDVEKKISQIYGEGGLFERESSAYKLGRPLFSRWTGWFYKTILPLTLLMIITNQILAEYSVQNTIGIHFYWDLIMFILILVSSMLYLLMIHFKK